MRLIKNQGIAIIINMMPNPLCRLNNILLTFGIIETTIITIVKIYI